MTDFVGPPRSKRLKGDDSDEAKKQLIVVLENCSLESAKFGKNYEILSSDKHAGFLRKMKKDPSNYRPDILHQCLLMLMDSPLNRSGMLRVYVHTQKNVLIEINPQTRIPRTFDRFCGLMTQLLHKLSIRAAESSQKLLKVIKCPVSVHLPVGCRKYLTSFNAPSLIDCREVVPKEDGPVVVVIGGMAVGKVSTDYTDQEIKISSFPLSAALTCAKVTTAFEEVWNVK